MGETLRAEIEIPSITADEAASLKASVASPAAFSAAGLEYSPAMAGLQANLARRPDGRFYLRLTTDSAINDPYIDMILEASWASGRIVRDFTMLFDPPSFRQPTMPAPTLPQNSGAVSAPAQAKAMVVPPVPTEPAARANKPAPRVQPAAPSTTDSKSGQQVVVKPGDSASKIAVRTKPSDVSLDQMLVAMIRANPDAFASGNLNRLRAGAVLDLPSPEQAKAVPATEASQTVVAHSKDFDAFRRSLAGNAPKAAVEAADRKATGSVNATLEDKKAPPTAADKLTLSKGALKAKADEEAKLAKERADADAKARAQELAKNIEDLKKLGAESGSAAAAASQPAAAPTSPSLEVALPKPAAASEPAAPASQPNSTPPPAKPVAAAPASTMAPEDEPGLVESLMEDPMLPLAGGGLVALLGGLLLYRRAKGKKKPGAVDSTFMESSLQPESYFGASGGQQIDTAQGSAAGASSMGYTNSQMGSPDDVDPVAEADVYLAYGRDQQAEEILKAALPANPERLAIHTKLLEIYAKRRDVAGFLAGANEAFKLTGADSPEWARICELGQTIDPDNALYQPGGASSSAFVAVASTATAMESATQAIDPPAAASADVDLDLDFSEDETANSVSPAAIAPEPLAAVEPPADTSNGLDFDISGPAELDEPQQAAPEPAAAMPDLEFSLGDMTLDAPVEPKAEAPSLELPSFDTAEPAATPIVDEPPAKGNEGMLEFDLGSLSLDLDSGSAVEDAPAGDSSLETKLALAEEFVSIGDNDGARALIEEVVAEATGDLRERAQKALSNLS